MSALKDIIAPRLVTLLISFKKNKVKIIVFASKSLYSINPSIELGSLFEFENKAGTLGKGQFEFSLINI